jgi:pyoverdine/dityrosine biosynthesis protein Dit1
MISTNFNYESSVDNANRLRLRIPKHCTQQMVRMIAAILTFCRVGQHTYWGLGRFTVEVSISHADTPHTVGLRWTSDRPVAATST